MTAVAATGADLAPATERYTAMCRIRSFETTTARLYRDGTIPGFVHLSTGQEAVAVGVCSALRRDDVITSTHRGHGHVLAKGADVRGMFAELMGRATGTCGGMGGSMHIADPAVGVLGANGIVGAGIPIAAGAALAIRRRGQDRVAVAFFGDGAVATGAFHEAVNLAALWGLPLLLVCENNGWSEFSRTDDQHPVGLAARAAGYGIEHVDVDGNDVERVHDAASDAVARLRAGAGPILLEARTLRWSGHYEGDPQRYREHPPGPDDDPITRAARQLAVAGADPDLLARVAADVERETIRLATSAAADPWPEPAAAALLAYADTYPRPGPARTPVAEGAEPTRASREVRRALADALADDPAVLLTGIDVAGGNVFGITRGLAEQFPGRVLDTPIAETAVIGGAVGAALDGLVPVAELMYLDFVGVCLDQLLNQAAKVRLMTGGRAGAGLTVRTQYGIGRSSAAQHSQSIEALLAHVPGLVVVMPSAVEDHYGLLRAAIESPDPVVVIENRLLYERTGPPAAAGARTPLGRARVARPGGDITVVSASRGVWTCLEAAELLAVEGIEAEVIDLRTIAPWDRETVLGSLARTHRLVVHTEGVGEFGIAAEILATAAEEGFWSLDEPLYRVCGPRTPVPYSPPAEKAWLPSMQTVADRIRHACRDR